MVSPSIATQLFLQSLFCFGLLGSLATLPGCAPSAEERDAASPAEDVPSSSKLAPLQTSWQNRLSSAGSRHKDDLTRAMAAISSAKRADPAYRELGEPNGAGPYNEALSLVYYDRANAFYEIGAVLGDDVWFQRGDEAAIFYRDRFVSHPEASPEANGQVPGYWNFTDGLRKHFERTRDRRSRDAVILLATKGAYASPAPSQHERAASADRSREVAYGIIAHLNAEALGMVKDPWRDELVTLALGHADQWLGEAPWDGVISKKRYIRPFMIALTARALIRVFEREPNTEILSRLERLADLVWDSTWQPTAKAFRYTDRDGQAGEDISQGTEALAAAPDLNLLIFPLYSWLSYRTADADQFERAVEIFRGGLENAFWNGEKQFNQQLFWSRPGFDWLVQATP